jgi:hypothetical protein
MLAFGIVDQLMAKQWPFLHQSEHVSSSPALFHVYAFAPLWDEPTDCPAIPVHWPK